MLNNESGECMRIKDFVDMKKFESIMADWAEATGLATVAVDAEGNYISDCYNFTDFCMKYTRGCEIGRARCEKCDKEGHGVYHCHAGLMDFAVDLKVGNEKVGSVIGGQVLPKNPDEEAFRRVAREIGVDENRYIEALHKVNVRTQSAIEASAGLLGEVLNQFITSSYLAQRSAKEIVSGINECNDLMSKVKSKMSDLNDIQSTLGVLALNAKIEAAHAGDKGAGFAVVADQVRSLSDSSTTSYAEIDELISKVVQTVDNMERCISQG